MNKHDLIDAISGRLGGKKTATEAVNALLDTIQSTVAKGDKVAITGFGVFEKAVRPARTARNPATGSPSRRCQSSALARISRLSSTARRRSPPGSRSQPPEQAPPAEYGGRRFMVLAGPSGPRGG